MPALDGLRVLDLTIGMAGPLAGMMLADHGAEVVRALPAGAEPDSAVHGHRMWSRGKSAVVLDPDAPAGRELLAGLVAGADVVLAGCDEAAITHERLTGLARPAGATWVVVPAYLPGETPWAGGRESAGLLFAAMGHAWGQASYADVPVDCAFPVALCLQGLWAAAVAVAASAPGGGQGGVFVVGGAHAAVLASPGSFAISRGEAHVHRPGGPAGSLPNYRCYRCGDGRWLFLGAFTAAFIRQALRALGLGELLAHDRLRGDLEAIRAPENFPWVAGALDGVFATRDRDHWLEVLRAADVPVSPIGAGGSWLDHPQVDALGLWASVRDEAGAEWVMPGVPVTLSETPGRIGGLAAQLGEEGAGSLPGRWSQASGLAGLAAGDTASAFAQGGSDPGDTAAGALPLAGTRVIDLGTIIAGPLVGTLLAALGADVVKVERPPGGDEYRVAHGGRGGAGFPAYNRGQRSIGVDLRSPGGAGVLARLVQACDVVVDNYRPGVAARLGLGWPDLRALNPAVSTVSVSAFGDAGPLGGRPGFDPVVQAMSGVMRTQGGCDENDSPAFLTIPVNDVIAATLGAFGACCALFARAATGRGQQVSVTLTAAAALLQADSLVAVDGVRVPAAGGRDFAGPGPLRRLYQASDGWVRVDGRWPEDGKRLADAGLLTACADGRGSAESTGSGESAGTGTGRAEAAAGEALGAFIADSTVAAAVKELTAAGVPAVAARQAADLLADRSLRRHGVLEAACPDVADPAAEGDPAAAEAPAAVAAGRLYLAAEAEQPELAQSPGFGEHTMRVLGELGYSEAEATALLARGEVAAGP